MIMLPKAFLTSSVVSKLIEVQIVVDIVQLDQNDLLSKMDFVSYI
jgi:hypothetical protein